MAEPREQSALSDRHVDADARPIVYLERDVLTAPEPTDDRRRRPVERRLVPGAADALAHLAEARYDIVLLGEIPVESLVGLGITLRFESVVAPGGEVWLITADPAACEERPAGVSTILVGPRRPPGRRPTAHCDIEARDLPAAVMEILARGAMVG